MEKKQYSTFWQSLIIAIIIFSFGIFIGFQIESSRLNQINTLYANSELSLLDIKIQSEIANLKTVDCKILINENEKFADRIYNEAKILQEYEDASRMTEDLKLQHSKYDLLRALFWVNSLKIQNNCKTEFQNIVYFYQYNEPSIETKAKQSVISNLLKEVKNDYGNKVMLIPLAGDNNITSIEIMIKQYNITQLPTILINEKTKITEILSKEELEKYL